MRHLQVGWVCSEEDVCGVIKGRKQWGKAHVMPKGKGWEKS